MNSVRTHKVYVNSVVTLVTQIAQIILGFFVRKVFIRYLGVEYLGYNSVFVNILQMLNLADLGIGVAITSYLYKPLAQNDNARITAIMGIYKKLYSTISSFLNSELELLTFDDVTDEVRDVLGAEYKFIDNNGQTLIQKDKIGKIGEYTFHVLLTNYYKVHCIVPKFRCTTDRNMSVFGIDALFLDPSKHTIFFGESKVSQNIDNAITLINRSLFDYEKQISEEYKLVLSNDESFNLSPEFLAAFKEHTDVCITFEEFIKAAHIEKICVPTFIAHGNSATNNTIEEYLRKMNTKIIRKNYFGLETVYLFISLPIIDKEQMMDVIMRKVVKKCNDYRSKHVTV